MDHWRRVLAEILYCIVSAPLLDYAKANMRSSDLDKNAVGFAKAK